MEIIQSTQNKKIKERAKLQKKKERDRSNLFLVEGKHLLEEAQKAQVLEEVFLLENLENPTTVEARYCNQMVLNKLSMQNSDAKMIGVCKKRNYLVKMRKLFYFSMISKTPVTLELFSEQPIVLESIVFIYQKDVVIHTIQRPYKHQRAHSFIFLSKLEIFQI